MTSEGKSLEEFIQRLPLFAGLNTADAERLVRSSQRTSVKAGEVVIEEGTPGDTLLVILSGELEVTKRDGDREIVLASRKAGEFLGEMSLLEKRPRTASARAVRESEILAIGPEAFRALLEDSPSAATTMLRTVADRLRSTEALLMQSEKLASLGTLAAGLAHELNNPASAIQRSSAYLRDAFEAWRQRTAALHTLNWGDQERQQLGELERSVNECGAPRPHDLASGDEESRLISELESWGIEEPWEIAPVLVTSHWTVDRVRSLRVSFPDQHLNPVLQWLGAGLAAQQLIEEIHQSAQAITEIVRAVKSYAYLDRAPVQNVDLRTSLEDTLVILRHKLKNGIEVVRDFEPELPSIEAYAGEINQVWTNIIDNAIHAMAGKGVLELHVRRVGEHVEVTIVDSGTGIPAEIASRIFDPFFTTKAQGVGSGLGLHIAHNIVVNRHRGRINVHSRPGRTEFRIALPLRLSREVKSAAEAARSRDE